MRAEQVPHRPFPRRGQLARRVEILGGVSGAQGLRDASGTGTTDRGDGWSTSQASRPGGERAAGRWRRRQPGRPASLGAGVWPAATAGNGPAPGRVLGDGGQSLWPGPDLEGRVGGRRPGWRAVRRARGSSLSRAGTVALSVPMRRLAPPVRSSPAAGMGPLWRAAGAVLRPAPEIAPSRPGVGVAG